VHVQINNHVLRDHVNVNCPTNQHKLNLLTEKEMKNAADEPRSYSNPSDLLMNIYVCIYHWQIFIPHYELVHMLPELLDSLRHQVFFMY